MIVYPKNAEENTGLCKWVESRIDGFTAGDATCIAVCTPTEILAVVCYNNYYLGRDIEISFASDHPRWAHKKTISGLLEYPFFQLKVQRVTAKAVKSNKRIRRFMQGIGFVEEGKLRHAGRNNESMFIYGLLKEDYLKRYHGKKESTSSTSSS